jgi:hypothetical protein
MNEKLVFTDQFIEGVNKKFGHLPSHRKPDIYWISTRKEYEERRAEIEHLVTLLPQDKRTNVIARIRKEDQHVNVYNELFVGDMLRKLGYEIEYENPIDGTDKLLTPDWYVFSKGDISSFYVEVFTPTPHKNDTEGKSKWRDLCERLEKLRIPVGISIYANEHCDPPDPKRSKKLADLITTWLQESSLQNGDYLRINCETLAMVTDPYAYYWKDKILVVEISKYNSTDQKSTWCVEPINVQEVLIDSLQKNIEIKISRYRRALEDQKIPFVICLKPHQDSLLTHYSIADAIWGELVTELYEDKQGNPILKDRRKDNGVFSLRQAKNEILGAVVWLSKARSWSSPAGEPTIFPYTTYANPFALYPLPPHALDFSNL